VPLNSPRPFESIAALRATLPPEVLLGAGTVMKVEEIPALKAAGGELVVMPHADTALIRAAKAEGLLCIPGVATPTEAFAARAAGADALKLFPAEALPPLVLKAWRAVLPPALRVLPVGGVTPDSLAAWRAAGAGGAGLGSALYAPGRSAADVGARARAFAEAWNGQAG
jgi:2-dehydro-3-deoxyphosphogalactonate aldolase